MAFQIYTERPIVLVTQERWNVNVSWDGHCSIRPVRHTLLQLLSEQMLQMRRRELTRRSTEGLTQISKQRILRRISRTLRMVSPDVVTKRVRVRGAGRRAHVIAQERATAAGVEVNKLKTIERDLAGKAGLSIGKWREQHTLESLHKGQYDA
jgi:hypothetical protein